MSSSPTTHAGGSRTSSPPGPHLVRPTSPSKSRLTIRLPDVNAPRAAEATLADPDRPLSEASAGGPVAAAAAAAQSANASQSVLATANQLPLDRISQVPSAIRRLSSRTLSFVRQPKFWLACVVAIAVQVVLALIFTPTDSEPDTSPRPVSAKAPESRPSAPAARIVVPAAPVSVNEERHEPMPATTPMGPAAPLESPGEASAQLEASPSPSEADSARATAPLMADNHRLARESSRYDGQAAGQSDGAALEGIAPIDRATDPATLEQPQ